MDLVNIGHFQSSREIELKWKLIMLQTICNPCFLIIYISMKIVKNPCMQEFQQKIALKQTYILIGFP